MNLYNIFQKMNQIMKYKKYFIIEKVNCVNYINININLQLNVKKFLDLGIVDKEITICIKE
jgi:hypothetical protein